MPDENEQDALSKIKVYLDAGHSIQAIREAGWGEWLDYFASKGVSLDGAPLVPPPSARPRVEGLTPAVEEVSVGTEPETAQAGPGEMYATNGGVGRRIRHSMGYALITVWGVLNFVIQIAIYISLATGIWWPLIQVIIDDPVSAIWIIPIGFFLTALSAMILRFIYGLLLAVVAIPGGALTMWLLRDAD